MSKFKEQIACDIDNAFANTDEFFEMHTVNGKSMPIMLDENENMDRTKFQTKQHEGTNPKQILIYVRASDFGRLPTYGHKIVIDKASFRVVDTLNESGMYSITLEAVSP